MIFARHDFTTNFFNAVGLDDKFMETNILIDEIARIIVDDKKSVVDALRSIGINVTYQDNNDTVKAYVVKEITNGNDKIINFFTQQIIKNQLDTNQLMDVAQKFKADATANPKQQTKAGQLITSILSDPTVQQGASTLISNGIKSLFAKTNANQSSNAQQLAERLKLNQMQAANKKENKYVALKVIGALILAGGLGYLIYFFATRNSGSSAPSPSPAPAPAST
jgi:flagellar basal body-associated protein FliL